MARPIPGWTPSNPEVRGREIDDVVGKHPAVAIHFGAPWNGVDPLMDESIRAITERFAGRLRFVSCNVDLEETVDLCRRCGVSNIPALSVLLAGRPRRFIMGYRAPEELAHEIESRLHVPELKPWWAFWR